MNDAISLIQAIDGFMLSLYARSLSENTIRDYQTTLNYLCEYLSHDFPLQIITRKQLRQFLASRPVSNKTLYNYYVGLSAFWTWAVSEELVTEHIVKKIPRPKPELPDIIPYSEDDVKKMLSSLERSRVYQRRGYKPTTHSLPFPERNRAILLLLLDSGVRAQELCSLKFHQLDLKNFRINVWGKGAKQRSIPISSSTANAIWRYRTTRKEDLNMGEPVFVNDSDRPLTIDRLLDIVQVIGERAGVVDVTVHRFRHTFAINYLRNGGDVYTLQRILGHSTLNMVKRYLSIAQADIQEAHRKASPVVNWGL